MEYAARVQSGSLIVVVMAALKDDEKDERKQNSDADFQASEGIDRRLTLFRLALTRGQKH